MIILAEVENGGHELPGLLFVCLPKGHHRTGQACLRSCFSWDTFLVLNSDVLFSLRFC